MECINKILNEYHLKSGHGSKKTMLFLIKEKYSWPSMAKHIEEHIKSCIVCLKSGGENVNSKNRIIKTTKPNEMWQVDLIGRIQGQDGKNKFIFTAVDHYTKYLEAAVMETKEAKITVGMIRKLILEKHGIPKTILSDNGLEFNNDQIRQLTEEYGFKWLYNSPGHHKTVGAIERANQTLLNKLKKINNFENHGWECLVDQAVLAYNISFHRAIDTSPFNMKFGKHFNFEVDELLKTESGKVSKQELMSKKDRKFGKYSIKDIQKGKKCYKQLFKIGDAVLICKKQMGDKLGTDWSSGFHVVDKIGLDSYLVSDGKKVLKLNKVHMRLREKNIGEGNVVVN